MSDKLKCSIDVDDILYQADCHWEHDRVIVFTWKVLDISLVSNLQFLYSVNNGAYTSISAVLTKDNDTYKVYTSEIDLSTLTRPTDDYLKIKAKIKSGVEETETEYTYYWVVPPVPTTVTLERKSADHIVCSWAKPADIENNPSVAGYYIELFCKKKGSNIFNQISGISLAEDAEGKYKLIQTTATQEYNAIEDATLYVNQNINLEAYLPNPDKPSFYFRPRDFDIVKDDYFMVRVYPCITYSQYWDEAEQLQPSARLSSEGDESDEMKFTLGVVRVKTDQGWKEGQVWVMTASGWKEADSIYVKTNTGWKEAIS